MNPRSDLIFDPQSSQKKIIPSKYSSCSQRDLYILFKKRKSKQKCSSDLKKPQPCFKCKINNSSHSRF